MLNRISNINSGLDYKGSTKFKRYRKNGNESFEHHINAHDSIDITPVLNFFDDSKWKLKNINKASDNKIYLDFMINEFSFKLPIDTAAKISFLRYSVQKVSESSVNTGIIEAEILVEIKKRLNLKSYDSLSMLEVLFSRIERLNLSNELTRSDTNRINELYDGIHPGLFKEFEAISSVVLNFVERFSGVKIELKEFDGNLIENKIAIDRIKILNA